MGLPMGTFPYGCQVDECAVQETDVHLSTFAVGVRQEVGDMDKMADGETKPGYMRELGCFSMVYYGFIVVFPWFSMVFHGFMMVLWWFNSVGSWKTTGSSSQILASWSSAPGKHLLWGAGWGQATGKPMHCT